MTVRACLLSALVAVSTACRPEIVPEPYEPTGAHDAYRHGLELAGLSDTALGRDWASAAESALRSPVRVETPFRETFYVDPAEVFAMGYRFAVKRGQRTEVVATLEPRSEWRIFLDLFRVEEERDEGPVHVASGGERDLRLAFEPRRDAVYLLRVQSELLRGGTSTIEIRNVASLEFPVAGQDTRAIGSSFGAPREAGRREHHGVDIFAPRHTVVRATSRARVRRVDDWKLGGRIIWLEDPARDLRLYFAHLETQEVSEGEWVEPGERIGTVGNSGNARTTPPHLHFGIYARGEGPIDPHPFLHQPKTAPPPIEVDLSPLGRWVRTKRAQVRFLLDPAVGNGSAHLELTPRTPLRIRGGIGSRYRVELPSGVTGFIRSSEIEGLDSALGSVALARATPLRALPSADAAVVEHTPAGTMLDVLGHFGSYSLVGASRRNGWILTPEIAP